MSAVGIIYLFLNDGTIWHDFLDRLLYFIDAREFSQPKYLICHLIYGFYATQLIRMNNNYHFM